MTNIAAQLIVESAKLSLKMVELLEEIWTDTR